MQGQGDVSCACLPSALLGSLARELLGGGGGWGCEDGGEGCGGGGAIYVKSGGIQKSRANMTSFT